MEPKFWKQINFVGHMENGKEDAKKLLLRIGAWDYGKTGWGTDGNSSFLDPNVESGRNHATNAHDLMLKYYTPEIERMAFDYLRRDYENEILGFSKRSLFTKNEAQ